ncbi:unnamed protein product [Caenorhabditis sp. 36 PRJEB53466]|nr:unnamed protein product [Caenorhabditis sp. 36 PRJEB53466]
MMICEKNGTCYTVKDQNVLSSLVEAFASGSPFSAFLLAAEIYLCLMFLCSIPNTRKDFIFWYLATIFAPFIVKMTVEAAFFISIYFYTSSYTYISWIHDSVVSFCYSSFLFNFEYGMVIYSMQTVKVAVSKKKVSTAFKSNFYVLDSPSTQTCNIPMLL